MQYWNFQPKEYIGEKKIFPGNKLVFSQAGIFKCERKGQNMMSNIIKNLKIFNYTFTTGYMVIFVFQQYAHLV